jgi:hypothetical protein
VSSHAALVYFDLTLNKTAGRKSGDESDPTGSPRHEQTVAVALKVIIAQRAGPRRQHELNRNNPK